MQSFVGAIALGYLLAQVILHFVGIFASPVQGWIAQKELHGLKPGTIASGSAKVPLQYAMPELIRFLLLGLVWYVLMRWLYFKPIKEERPEPSPNSDRAA